MAGTRSYHRDNKGRFAGASGGTHVTHGRAGGFANAAHRSAVQGRKVRKARNRRVLKVTARVAGTAGAAALAGALASRGVGRYADATGRYMGEAIVRSVVG